MELFIQFNSIKSQQWQQLYTLFYKEPSHHNQMTVSISVTVTKPTLTISLNGRNAQDATKKRILQHCCNMNYGATTIRK